MTWQPTWRRLIASTLVLFTLMLVVLVWRVQAGDDPALRAKAAARTPPSTATPATGDDGLSQQLAPQQTVPVPDDGGLGFSGPSTHQS